MKSVVSLFMIVFATVSVWAVSVGEAVPGRPGIVYASTDGSLIRPAPGYTWTDRSMTDVKWTPGIRHTDYPNVIASTKKDNWNPAPGYKWANDRPGDFTVIRNVVRITCPRCEGTKFERCPSCGGLLGHLGKVRCSACRGTGYIGTIPCVCMGGTMDCISCTLFGDRALCRQCGGNGFVER